MSHKLVLPNLASFRSRGKLAERWSTAKEAGCDLIELPADLVKSLAEEARTGRAIGTMLTKEEAEDLYGPPSLEAKMILHTDPGIPRRDRNGGMVMPRLRWDDPEWSSNYAQSVGWIAQAAGGAVEAVELHPGREGGSIEDLASGFKIFETAISSAMGEKPLILIENKHRHRISSVEDMVALTELLPDEGCFGLVVDVSNLWKTYRSRTSAAMADLPWDCIKAFHIHFKHRAPRADDPIDWELLLRLIRDHAGALYLNPEVFHWKEFQLALRMIKSAISA